MATKNVKKKADETLKELKVVTDNQTAEEAPKAADPVDEPVVAEHALDAEPIQASVPDPTLAAEPISVGPRDPNRD